MKCHHHTETDILMSRLNTRHSWMDEKINKNEWIEANFIIIYYYVIIIIWKKKKIKKTIVLGNKNTQTEVKLSGNFCFVFDSFLKTNFISNFKTIVILPIPYLDSTTYENNSLFLYFCFVVIVIMMMMFNTIFINGKNTKQL